MMPWSVRLASEVKGHQSGFFGASGMLSLRGVRPVSSVWRSYCLLCLNLSSVPWRRSSTPNTPKHWLNLEPGKQQRSSQISHPEVAVGGAPLIRQVDTPEMVKVMELGGGQEGEVVSTVGDGGADQSHAVPHGGGGHV